jgi:ABC-type sulfate transport system substrate-binding protein
MAWPMVVAMGAAALMKQDAKNKAQSEYNWWKNRKDKNTVKALRIQAGNARQGVADLTRQKINTEDITAETKVSNELEKMRRVASIKATGGPEGQSTDAFTDRSIGEVLIQENAFLKNQDVKYQQLAMQEREVRFGMDMAFLDAQASIDSTSYKRGDGGRGLFMDFASIYAKS